MTEHNLIEIAKEEGSKESRFHYVCSCGQLGSDHGAKNGMFEDEEAKERVRADHKIHAEGKDPNQAPPEKQHEMSGWSETVRREGR